MSDWFRPLRKILWLILGAGIVSATGCGSAVVVYTAQDEEFAQPVFDQFERATHLKPAAKFDVESTKTVGLVNEIIAEAQQPRCDVFWNNEILNTLRLEKLGLLEPYRSPAAEAFDAQWKSPNGTWTGFAARARILIVNKNLAGGDDKPKSIEDLTAPKWRGKIGIAKPLFGTTATQVACLFALWGDEKAKDYFRRLKANDPQILGGNKRVAEAVSAGQLAFGMTDTDDAMVEIEQGMPVEIIYPDQAARRHRHIVHSQHGNDDQRLPAPGGGKAVDRFSAFAGGGKIAGRMPQCADSAESQCRGKAARRNAENREADACRFPGRCRQMGRCGAVYSR